MGKIVLVSSFCTNLRIAKCSFTLSKLRFRYLASHKNNLTIDDFSWVDRVLASSFCTSASDAKMLT